MGNCYFYSQERKITVLTYSLAGITSSYKNRPWISCKNHDENTNFIMKNNRR